MNAGELEKAFSHMKSEPLIVQKMYRSGNEVIIGGKRDPHFGPVILFGLGGIFVEIFKDMALRVVPVDVSTAEEMIDEIQGVDILKGARGQKEADRKALIEALVNVSRLLTEHPEIITLDINPLIVFDKGQGCVAVDGKATFSDSVE